MDANLATPRLNTSIGAEDSSRSQHLQFSNVALGPQGLLGTAISTFTQLLSSHEPTLIQGLFPYLLVRSLFHSHWLIFGGGRAFLKPSCAFVFGSPFVRSSLFIICSHFTQGELSDSENSACLVAFTDTGTTFVPLLSVSL